MRVPIYNLDKIESEARDLIEPARAGDPIAEHLMATRYRGRVFSAAECAAETAARMRNAKCGMRNGAGK
jgi:hypothetical protein